MRRDTGEALDREALNAAQRVQRYVLISLIVIRACRPHYNADRGTHRARTGRVFS